MPSVIKLKNRLSPKQLKSFFMMLKEKRVPYFIFCKYYIVITSELPKDFKNIKNKACISSTFTIKVKCSYY